MGLPPPYRVAWSSAIFGMPMPGIRNGSPTGNETYLDGVSRVALAGEKIRNATELDAAVGGMSHVVTPPYATRTLAVEVVRGMKASGIPRAAVTGMGQ